MLTHTIIERKMIDAFDELCILCGTKAGNGAWQDTAALAAKKLRLLADLLEATALHPGPFQTFPDPREVLEVVLGVDLEIR